jgi:hypothetical protein
MKYLILTLTAFLIISCGSKLENEEKSTFDNKIDQVDFKYENPIPISNSDVEPITESVMATTLTYFGKEGVWDTIRAICPFNNTLKFHISDFNKTELTNIDSTTLFKYIQNIYRLKSVYPLRLLDLQHGWKGLVFFGEQYDSDEITDFLAFVTIDSNFRKKGELEFISGEGDFMGETWQYYTEFSNDSTFKLTRLDQKRCEDELGNQMTGEISELEYEQTFKITKSGKLNRISSDTLRLEKCK